MEQGVTPWIEALRGRGGPLVEAALAFVRRNAAAPFPAGAAGVRALAALLSAHCGRLSTSPSDDGRFVEGAGALLGLLLLDHLGRGEHRTDGTRHALALGAHGFFEPFAAIEAAVDADAPLTELGRRVREAEAEANGHGPVARVVSAFDRVLSTERPDLVIEHAFGLAVTVRGGVEVDLTRVARATEGQGVDALERATAKMVAMLPGGPSEGGLAWEEAQPRLLPRLLGQRFLDEVNGRLEGGAALAARPLGQDVHLALVVSYADRARFVRSDELAAWGVGHRDAEEAAVAQLAARSASARFGAVETPDGTLVMARTGDGLDAARLLLPGLFEVLTAVLEGPIVAAVPHRDTLLACGGDPETRKALAAFAAEQRARAPHPISDRLFAITPAGLSPRR